MHELKVTKTSFKKETWTVTEERQSSSMESGGMDDFGRNRNNHILTDKA